MYEHKLKDAEFIRFASRHPWPFYVRFYWENKIPYRMQNPEIDAGWDLPKEEARDQAMNFSPPRRIRSALVKSARAAFSQNSRNRNLDLLRLLRCPGCGSESLSKNSDALVCGSCGTRFPIVNDIPVMYPPGKPGAA
jgi:uncharacterized protein YbaR (Trm112 family)